MRIHGAVNRINKRRKKWKQVTISGLPLPSMDRGTKAVIAPGLVEIYAVAGSSRLRRQIRIARRPLAHMSINDDKATRRAIRENILSITG